MPWIPEEQARKLQPQRAAIHNIGGWGSGSPIGRSLVDGYLLAQGRLRSLHPFLQEKTMLLGVGSPIEFGEDADLDIMVRRFKPPPHARSEIRDAEGHQFTRRRKNEHGSACGRRCARHVGDIKIRRKCGSHWGSERLPPKHQLLLAARLPSIALNLRTVKNKNTPL